MAITYIDKSFLDNFTTLRIMHSDNASTYIIKDDKNKKLVLKKPYTHSKNTEKKLLYLDSIPNLPIVYPKHLLITDDILSSYIMNYIGEDSTNLLEKLTSQEKIEFLLRVRNNLEILHKNGIIHGNIKTSNILTLDNPVFCDLDDCIIKEEKLDMERPNTFYQNYLNRTKTIDENLDKYEFNIMTYCVLNNIRSPFLIEHRINKSIETNDFGYFKDNDSIKIIRRLLTFKDSYQDDYLIDSYRK